MEPAMRGEGGTRCTAAPPPAARSSTSRRLSASMRTDTAMRVTTRGAEARELADALTALVEDYFGEGM